MSQFVLDNSVTMRWLLPSLKTKDQDYAKSVLKSLINHEARVPNLWHLEVANVLLNAEKQKQLFVAEVEGFISQLEELPISADTLTTQQAFSRTITLARAYKLSSYDAAYLELAVREQLPLATLDTDLAKAARKAEIDLYQPI